MSFSPTYSQQMALLVDREFTKRIAEDKKLKHLATLAETEREDDISEMIQFMGGSVRLSPITTLLDDDGNPKPLDVHPLTCGTITLLSLIGSPYITHDWENYTSLDTDRALWILINGKDSFTKMSNIDSDMIGMGGLCDSLGVDWTEINEKIKNLIYQTFYPLSMLPDDDSHQSIDNGKRDCHWMSGVITRACRMTNESMEKVEWEIPLLKINHLLVCDEIWNGRKNVGRRTKRDLSMQRQYDMMEKRLKELGLLNNSAQENKPCSD